MAKDLTTDFELRGKFWLPANQSRQVSGLLQYSADSGLKLFLNDCLREFPEAFNDPDIEGGHIVGIIEGGKNVSLLDCFRTNYRMGFGTGLHHETYHVHMATIGCTLDEPNEKFVKHLRVRFSSFEQWVGATGYSVEPSKQRCRIDIDQQPPIELYSSQSLSLKLQVAAHIDSTSLGPTAITPDPFLMIETEDALSVKDALKKAADFQDFLTMLCGYILPFSHLTVMLEEEGRKLPVPVDLFFGRIDVKPPRNLDPIFSFSQELVTNALSRWHMQREKLESAIPLLRSILSTERMLGNVRFLLATQALETLHRRALGGRLVDEITHDEVKESLYGQIPVQLPNSYVQRLRSVIGYSNEKGMKRRIDDFVFLMSLVGLRSIDGVTGKFSKRVTVNRNYFTHFEIDNRRLLFDGGELYWASQRLAIMCLCAIFGLLEIGSSSVAKAIEARQEYQRALATSGDPF